MAALQRNKVSLVGLKTHMPPLAEIWLLCSVSNAPVAQMKLHEGNVLLYFKTGPPEVKLSVSIYCDTITNVTDGHVSDESHKYRQSKDII